MSPGSASGAPGSEPVGPIQCLIVDDAEMWVKLVTAVVITDPRFQLVGTARDLRHARQGGGYPDVVLLDLGLEFGPDDEDRTVERAHARWGDAAILVATDREDLMTVFAALAQGADGLVSKRSDDDLFEAIVDVANGRNRLDARFAAQLYARYLANDRPDTALFTERQGAVLDLLSLGFSNHQIARRLDVSDKAVEKHLNNLFSAFHAENRTDLLNQVLNVTNGRSPSADRSYRLANAARPGRARAWALVSETRPIDESAV